MRCLILFYYYYFFFARRGGGGGGGGGGVNLENCLLLTNNQYTETGDWIRVVVMSQGDL